jgi:predicted dehydrogenase
LNYTQIPPKHSLEIIGTKGSIFWDYNQNSILLNSIDLSGKVKTETILAPEGFDRNDMFIAEMENFIEVIHDREEPVCSLSDGVAALDLALEALNKGQ